MNNVLYILGIFEKSNSGDITFNWEAIGSIGTLLAIIVALKQNKSKIQIRARRDGAYRYSCEDFEKGLYDKGIHCGNIIVNISNLGLNSVEISNVGFRMPHSRYTFSENELKKSPYCLSPGKSIEFDFKLPEKDKGKIEKMHAFYAVDSIGRVYYQKANLLRKITRFLWWNIGKYFKKYRKFSHKNPK